MKILKKLVLILVVAILAILILSCKSYATGTCTNEETDYTSGDLKYRITISSEGLPEDIRMELRSSQNYSKIDENYQIMSDYLYKYLIYENPPSNAQVTSLNDETATINIKKDGLVEGTKYDVYYMDEHNSIDSQYGYPITTYSIDETLNGTEAEVVKINGQLYIQLTTTSLKPFALNQKVSTQYKNKLNKITENGVYMLNAANPKDYEYFQTDSYLYVINGQKLGYTMDMIYGQSNEKLLAKLTFDDLPNETHIIEYQYKYNDIDQKIKKILDEITNELKNELEGQGNVLMKVFTVEDLSYINYLNSKDTTENDIIYYSNELRETLKGTNLIPYFDYRMGDSSEFNKEGMGIVSVSYEGILYPLGIDGGYRLKSVIYVPSDTENTDTALILAAKVRIAKYLGIDSEDVNLTVGGTRESLTEERWDNYDIDKISNNYYNLVINGHHVKVVIERNSDKAKELEFTTKDVMTDIQINSKSGTIPLDTLIKVKKMTTGAEYDKIIKILNIADNEMFDLKLYSDSLDKYITELEDGSFEVRIPISEKFKGKDLIVYYVDENNNKVEYPVRIEGEFAVFNTNHFSIYTLAEKS